KGLEDFSDWRIIRNTCSSDGREEATVSAETSIRRRAFFCRASFCRAVLCPAILLFTLESMAQTPMESAPRINATDRAALETREIRKDLACTVVPNKPELGFDLRFHLGFDVSVPLNELAGSENQLTILFRVISDLHKDKPRYFAQHIHVPEIADDAKGEANLRG